MIVKRDDDFVSKKELECYRAKCVDLQKQVEEQADALVELAELVGDK